MLSRSRGALALQALKHSAGALLGQDCMLCGGGSAHSLVCDACESSLPLLGAACAHCAIPMPRSGICGECVARPFAFDEARARFQYRFPVDRVIHRFKYAGDLAAGRWLARQLALAVAELPRPDLLVAPPLARARLRERGFNQALEIAKTLATSLRVRCDIAGVSRAHETAPQPGLGRKARRANLRGAFRCNLQLTGARVVIVDDVLTTGATAEALARVLKLAGAAHVGVWTLARTPEPGR